MLTVSSCYLQLLIIIFNYSSMAILAKGFVFEGGHSIWLREVGQIWI